MNVSTTDALRSQYGRRDRARNHAPGSRNKLIGDSSPRSRCRRAGCPPSSCGPLLERSWPASAGRSGLTTFRCDIDAEIHRREQNRAADRLSEIALLAPPIVRRYLRGVPSPRGRFFKSTNRR
jgi:hypothetical protein